MSKDYIAIDMNGTRIGMKFGTIALQQYCEKEASLPLFYPQTDGVDRIPNELGISHILYAGYVNCQYMKGESLKIPFEYFYEYVESVCAKGRDDIAKALAPAVKCFTESALSLGERNRS